MALHSGSEISFLSQTLVSSRNSELHEGARVQLESSAKPESTKRDTAYGIKQFQQWLDRGERRAIRDS